MITEQDLREAIAECEGQRNPGANTCLKLAAFYTIKDHLFPTKEQPATRQEAYSFAAAPETAHANSESEFLRAMNGRNVHDVLPLLDELMTTLSVINPRLYAGVLRKLNN